MDTLNDRIRLARKHLSLSQKEFADKLGVSQRSVSWSEQPGNNVPDSTIKSICLAFSINEEWLRFGTGPMNATSNSFDLEQYVLERGGDALELEILKTYFSLPKEIRKTALQYFLTSVLSSTPASSHTVEELEAEYKKRNSASASTTTSTVSSTTTDAEKASGDQ